MEYKKHDINSSGFYVDEELLAHDLAMLMVSRSNIGYKADSVAYYELYLKKLKEFRNLIDDKTRYDSTLNNP